MSNAMTSSQSYLPWFFFFSEALFCWYASNLLFLLTSVPQPVLLSSSLVSASNSGVPPRFRAQPSLLTLHRHLQGFASLCRYVASMSGVAILNSNYILYVFIEDAHPAFWIFILCLEHTLFLTESQRIQTLIFTSCWNFAPSSRLIWELPPLGSFLTFLLYNEWDHHLNSYVILFVPLS